MKTEFVFHGEPNFIEELDTFFISQDLYPREAFIIKAHEPPSKGPKKAQCTFIKIVQSVERIAKAYLAFLETKGTKCKITIQAGDDNIEIVKGDAPDKVEHYLQKHKGGSFDIDITL